MAFLRQPRWIASADEGSASSGGRGCILLSLLTDDEAEALKEMRHDRNNFDNGKLT